MVEVT